MKTNIIFPIELALGKDLKPSWHSPDTYHTYKSIYVDPDFFDDHENLLKSMLTVVPNQQMKEIGEIKFRHSKQHGKAVLCNGCFFCDTALFGHRPRGLEIEKPDFVNNAIAHQIKLEISPEWQQLIAKYWGEHWDIYPS
jgi:hypothetical protein